MNLFDVTGASYFCSRFQRRRTAPIPSLRIFTSTSLRGVTRLVEGTGTFEDYRHCVLRNADRHLFLAASLYRRSLDLMTVSACPWAHTTLYYSAFFAASATVEMFGGFLDAPKLLIEVTVETPNSQELSVVRNLRSRSNYRGSHQMFWDLYYRACAKLTPWIPRSLSMAVVPVSNDPVWQSERRNDINYDTYLALDLASTFQRGLRTSRFPHSLPGVLSTQFQVSRAMVELAFHVAKDLRLRTDALGVFGPRRRRRRFIRDLVYSAQSPRLPRSHMASKILV